MVGRVIGAGEFGAGVCCAVAGLGADRSRSSAVVERDGAGEAVGGAGFACGSGLGVLDCSLARVGRCTSGGFGTRRAGEGLSRGVVVAVRWRLGLGVGLRCGLFVLVGVRAGAFGCGFDLSFGFGLP